MNNYTEYVIEGQALCLVLWTKQSLWTEIKLPIRYQLYYDITINKFNH